jgi:apolipoprotein N-acyltransferase
MIGGHLPFIGPKEVHARLGPPYSQGVSDSAVAEVITIGPASPPAITASRLRSLFMLAAAALSGAVLGLAFPGTDWWPFAPLAVAGLALASRGARARTAAAMGWLFGMAFFVPHLHWSGIYVGALPWFALAAVESAYVAAMAAFLPRAWRARGGTAGRTLAITGLWVAQEAIRGSVPFGGFPWGRLAFSQSSSPFAGLAALAGAPGVTAAVAATGALAACGAVSLWRHRLRAAAGAALAASATMLAGPLVPRPVTGPMIRVAAVQGNVPVPGLDFNAERRAVLDNHARATLELAARVKAGVSPQPALVVWPENASDIDPLRNPDAARVIDRAATAIGVPIVVGAVLQEPADKLSNASIVWTPGAGPGERYVKQHPAPFGEYIPYRSFFRRFSDKVDLVAKDFTHGTRTGLLTIDQARGLRLGDVICFEVAYDGLVRDSVRAGASLLAVQTNNATFGYTDESVQQLAMSRLRAIESGRSVIHVSTVGISAIIGPGGTVEQRSGHFTQQVLEADVPLRTTMTMATRAGAWPEWILAGLGAALVLAATRGTAGARSAKGQG